MHPNIFSIQTWVKLVLMAPCHPTYATYSPNVPTVAQASTRVVLGIGAVPVSPFVGGAMGTRAHFTTKTWVKLVLRAHQRCTYGTCGPSGRAVVHAGQHAM